MPVIFGLILIITVLIAYEKRKSDKLTKKSTEEFWSREQQSNMIRRKDISMLPYLSIPYDTLPFSSGPETEELSEIKARLFALKGERIINLSGRTNTELKLAYGTANLPDLIQYDQNYIVLIRSLSRFAALLYENGNSADAERVLQYTLSIGSDIRNDYLLLARIYLENNAPQKIDALISQAESLETLTKQALLTSLRSLRFKNGLM